MKVDTRQHRTEFQSRTLAARVLGKKVLLAFLGIVLFSATGAYTAPSRTVAYVFTTRGVDEPDDSERLAEIISTEANIVALHSEKTVEEAMESDAWKTELFDYDFVWVKFVVPTSAMPYAKLQIRKRGKPDHLPICTLILKDPSGDIDNRRRKLTRQVAREIYQHHNSIHTGKVEGYKCGE